MYYIQILAVVILIILLIKLRLRKYDGINKIPGPHWFELLKLFILRKSNIDLHNYILDLTKKYGPIVKIWIKPFPPALIVSDPKYFEAILGSKEHLNKTELYNLLSDLAGDGLGTVQDMNKWKSDRIFFNPIFKHKSITNYCVKLNYHMDNLKNVLIPYENKQVDTYFIIHRCAMSMILEYLMDENVNEEIATKIIHTVDKSLEMVFKRTFNLTQFDFVFRFSKMYKPWVEVHQFLDKIFKDLVTQKQIKLSENNFSKMANEDRNFIDLLLGSSFSKYSLLGHLKTFVLAGYDTVATTASFAIFEIAKHKDIQEKILEEYLSLAGSNKDYVLTFEDIQNMKYTESVIKETLRMYPAVPLIQRKLQSTVKIDGLCIPESTYIMFSITSLHNNKFSNPTVFNPDRFSPENENKLKPFSYAPFSLGPRNCIGKKIAMIELKFIISYIVRNFVLQSVEPEHKLELANDFTLKSKNGIPVIFKTRDF